MNFMVEKTFEMALANEAPMCASGRRNEINMSEIYTKLIQETGRFVEYYSSDLLYDIKDIEKELDKAFDNEGFDTIILVGLRESGVDAKRAVMHKLLETKDGIYGYLYPTKVYRKVYALRITSYNTLPGTACVNLYDVTHSLYRLADEDEGADW